MNVQHASVEHSCLAILLAAGSGQRMGTAIGDKVLADLGGKPVLAWSLQAFVASDLVRDLVVTYRDEQQRENLLRVAEEFAPQLAICWVRGGAERQQSVLHALECLDQIKKPAGCVVLIHDCARPLVRPEALRATAFEARASGAACLAHPARDTIKRLTGQAMQCAQPGPLEATAPDHLEDLQRARLWVMETPQAFHFDLILHASRAAAARGLSLTDDAAAVTACGHPVALVHNPFTNLKLTTPQDFAIAEALARMAATPQPKPCEHADEPTIPTLPHRPRL